MDMDTSFPLDPVGSTFTAINDDANMQVNANETDDMVTEATECPSTPPPATVTPRKRGRPKKPSDNDASADPENEDTPTKKSNGTPKKGLGPIPTSLDAAGLADKMILHMRDDEGKGWADITNAWLSMTGIKVGGSTLRMRYTTMKANFIGIGEDDQARLLKVKKEIEEKFEQEKWQKIAEGIEIDGGNKYPPSSLQKKFKELSKNDAQCSSG